MLHLAPTVGLLEAVRLLVPGAIPSRLFVPLRERRLSRPVAAQPERPPPPPEKRRVVRVVAATLGLHMSPGAEGPTLVWDGGPSEGLSARASGRSASLLVGVDALSLGARPTTGRTHIIEVTAEGLQVVACQVDARTFLVGRTPVTGSTAAFPMWIAQIEGWRASDSASAPLSLSLGESAGAVAGD